MSNYLKNYEYVKEQLIYFKTKIDIENKLGLYDINSLSESLFSNILNDVYELRLSNINKTEYLNYPAIDLIDIHNKKVFQVTSSSTAKKIRDTINLWRKGEKKEFELNFFYLKNKPKLEEKNLKEFANDGITEANFFDIIDILNAIESSPELCEKVFYTIQTHVDTLSFEFNTQSYFKHFESHLLDITSHAFEQYKQSFLKFIDSDKTILEVYSAGGNGKSHLLYEFSKCETEYIPLIFKKNVNISEDLKKLPNNKKFLFIFDDIDRFLDTEVFLELLSYVISHENIKLLISYRIASKSLVKSFYRKYKKLAIEELEIVWSDEDIIELIKTIKPNLDTYKVQKLYHQFNSNPYLITQALQGNIDSVKDFSLQTVEDTKQALRDFNYSNEFIGELLFKLSITVPLHENSIEQLEIENIKNILQRLESVNILRKLGKRYRFNPDIIGDLYLAYFIDVFGNKFEDILETYLKIFSHTVFTNISYALLYLQDTETLNKYIEKIIDKWLQNNDYSSHNLQLINKIVGFVPDKSFMYLIECTQNLKAQENEHIKGGIITQLVTKVSYSPDFNMDKGAINLGSIEPIVAQLIYMLKNNYDCGTITIKDIIDYLTSDIILNLPKPEYANHSLSSILKKLFSPLRTSNFQIILDAIDISLNWINEPINEMKMELFNESVLENLLSVSFEDNTSDGITYTWDKKHLNINHPEIQKIIFKVKNIALEMFDSKNQKIINYALELIRHSRLDYEHLNKESQQFYSEIKKEFLLKTVKLLQEENLDFFLLSKIDNISLNILRFDEEKDLAFETLKLMNRTDEFIFYQLIQNANFIISDFDKFYEEYLKQDNVIEWLHESQNRQKYHNEIGEEFLAVVDRLSTHYTSEKIVTLFNKLDVNNWGAYNKLLTLLDYWFERDKDVIKKVYSEYYLDIQNDMIKNVIKELLLKKGVVELHEDDITEQTSIDDLKIFIIIIFNNFDESKMVLIEKLLNVIESKNDNTISMFIGIIAGDIFFKLKQDEKLIELLSLYIYRLLELQFQHNFNFESYLTFSLEILKQHNKLTKNFTDLLHTMINSEEYKIERHELENIYSLLDVKLETLLDIIYKKLISKKPDGYYRYYFHNYMDFSELNEVCLLDSFVKTYDDFLLVTGKVEQYTHEFIEYADAEETRKLTIDLDWFFKHIIKKEYIEAFFEKLYHEYSIDKIELFYKIIPVKFEYINIIVKNMNMLSEVLKIDELINYLNRIGKIKSYTRSHMQNSDMILEEEKLFNYLYDNIASLPFRLKIKNILKYIEIEKRREIEEDIERIMDK